MFLISKMTGCTSTPSLVAPSSSPEMPSPTTWWTWRPSWLHGCQEELVQAPVWMYLDLKGCITVSAHSPKSDISSGSSGPCLRWTAPRGGRVQACRQPRQGNQADSHIVAPQYVNFNPSHGLELVLELYHSSLKCLLCIFGVGQVCLACTQWRTLYAMAIKCLPDWLEHLSLV